VTTIANDKVLRARESADEQRMLEEAIRRSPPSKKELI